VLAPASPGTSHPADYSRMGCALCSRLLNWRVRRWPRWRFWVWA
jgi:hypothetical protein